MDDDKETGNPFTIPDLWRLPKSHVEGLVVPSLLFSELNVDDINVELPDPATAEAPTEGFFTIPDLVLGPVDAPSSEPDGLTPPASEEPDGREELVSEADFDIWKAAQDVAPKVAGYYSWDSFENYQFVEAPTAYLTEAGARVFDAALAGEDDILGLRNQDYAVVDTGAYTSSLKSLGLGRDSLLFRWDTEMSSFIPTLGKVRISDHTGDSCHALEALFMSCGNTIKALKEFVTKTYARNKSPGQIALADAVSVALNTVQARLSDVNSCQGSILQLQSAFRPAVAALKCVHDLVVEVSVAKTDEEMLTLLFDYIQKTENRMEWFREVLLEILSRVSRPWLEFAGEWLGLQKEAGLPMSKEGPSRSFVKVEDRNWIDEQGMENQEPDYVYDGSAIPSFVSAEDAQVMFETGKSLRFLRVHHETHPLARADVVASVNAPALDWKFSWQDIEVVQAKASQYERDLSDAVKRYSINAVLPGSRKESHQDANVHFDFFGKPEEEMQASFLDSIKALDLPLSDEQRPPQDRLTKLLIAALQVEKEPIDEDASTFAPPTALTPALSFCPILSAQARIVNGTSMRLFFNSHNLREHLSVQRRFHLLGDGVFSSRLQHALFDPELETAERQRGVARSGAVMGLRLGGRDTWPPASSELRLALMGVLTESYHSSQANSGSYLDRNSELPGDLSFAVRDMSEDEITKCMNPDSISALDFLRLSYKPPAPLEAVITPLSLYKYDQLFKLLLRVMRMLYVVNQLFRDSTDRTSYWQGLDSTAQKLRIESRHFIMSIASYFFDTGIESTWKIFEAKLDEVASKLNDEDIVLGQHEGISKLREYHESILDHIMTSLFLRKRQKPVLRLLEEIFEGVLAFAKYSRERASGERKKYGRDEALRAMYIAFRKKVGVFIGVCRGLSERKGFLEGGTQGGGGLFGGLKEENTVAMLLARLEMSGYYSQTIM